MTTRRSWIDSANDPETDFPIENLPFGVIERSDADDRRIAVAIGDRVLDL
jgi:fumarylacetoacetase